MCLLLAGALMATGVDCLVRDKSRPSRIAPLKKNVIERVAALTLTDSPGETMHWTADLMAAASGISSSSVRRIWEAHCLQPHRCQQFKLSNDPKYVDISTMLLGCMSIRQRMPSCCRLMRRAKFKRLTGASQACRSNKDGSAR